MTSREPVNESPVAAEEVTAAEAAVEAEPQYMLLPVERSDLALVKCMKFARSELEALEKWGDLLAMTMNPMTGMPFIQRGNKDKVDFSTLMKFCINTTYNLVGQIFRELAQEEGKSG